MAFCAWSLAVFLVARRAAADDRPVHRPSFLWSEDNAKLYLNVYWSPKLGKKKGDDESLFGETGIQKPMDEVEVFFDTQTLEVFAFNNEEGYHLELPLRNRIVIKWSTFEKRDDGVDITLKKTRIGRWRSVQPLKGGYDIGREAMQVKLEDQARYDLFDAIQNNELRNWLETYPYHCLACNAIFDEVYKGDGASRELWSYFKQKPPPPPKSANKTTRAWKAYGDKIEAEFEFDYTCDPVWNSTTGLGGPDQTSEFSSSIKSKSIRLIFGRIDCSRRVLEAQQKA